jgi:hypothetical protein
LRKKDIIKGVLTGAFFVFQPHYSVKKSIYIIKLYTMQTENMPVNINMQKMIYGIIDYCEGKEDPYKAIYMTIFNECRKVGLEDNIGKIVTINDIKRAWDGNGATELAMLAIYAHYYNRKIEYGGISQWITRSLLRQQAYKVARNGSGTISLNEEQLRRIIREALEKICR